MMLTHGFHEVEAVGGQELDDRGLVAGALVKGSRRHGNLKRDLPNISQPAPRRYQYVEVGSLRIYLEPIHRADTRGRKECVESDRRDPDLPLLLEDFPTHPSAARVFVKR